MVALPKNQLIFELLDLDDTYVGSNQMLLTAWKHAKRNKHRNGIDELVFPEVT